jgi:hypothetical protein
MGLSPDDFAANDQPLAIWPDNLPSLTVFASLATQWRAGFSGPTGLDYNVMPTVFRLHGIERSRWPEMFDDIRAMETEALKTMSKKE